MPSFGMCRREESRRSPPISRASNERRRVRRDADRARQEAQAERLRAVWATPQGWRYWSAVNNSEVGVWYTAAAFGFMLFAGVLALPDARPARGARQRPAVGRDFYNQAFTLHGTVMMFLFAVPLFEAFSIAILPQMLAARDLPFPRLSAFGFWCFLIGGVFVSGSILFDAAPSGGWFMYPPLTTDAEQSGIGADIWLLGLSFIEVASIAAAVELIVGVLKCRPPGMRINLIPLYSLVHPGGRRDDPVRLSAADRGRPPVRDGARLRLAVLRCRRAAAIRCSGSTCSGSSAIPRSTSSSCRRSRWSR